MYDIIQIILLFFSTVLGILGYFLEFRKTDEVHPLKKTVWIPVSIIILMFVFGIIATYLKYQEDLETLTYEKREKNKQDSLRRIDDSIRTQQIEKLSENLKKTDDVLYSSKLNYEKLSNMSQVTELINSNLFKTYVKQNDLLDKQGKIQYHVLRSFYRLEPLTINFVIIYPMEDAPPYEDYANRLHTGLLEKVNAKRDYLLDDILDLRSLGDREYDITKDYRDLLPTENEMAKQFLLHDDTFFYFIQKNGNSINYTPTVDVNGDVIDSLQYKIHIALKANFFYRVFIKEVRYENPIRNDNDNESFSVIDLIGRNLTWRSFYIASSRGSYLSKIRFEFDHYHADKYLIDIKPDGKERDRQGFPMVTIRDKDVGLEKILDILKTTSFK